LRLHLRTLNCIWLCKKKWLLGTSLIDFDVCQLGWWCEFGSYIFRITFQWNYSWWERRLGEVYGNRSFNDVSNFVKFITESCEWRFGLWICSRSLCDGLGNELPFWICLNIWMFHRCETSFRRVQVHQYFSKHWINW
jgi:hypothetical protein